MQDDEPNRPRSRRWIVAIVVSLPFLYVLSYVIVLWIWSPLYNNVTPETRRALRTFYTPILWTAQNNDLFARALTWFIDLKK